MINKLQLSIIHGVSTILFEKQDLEYWVRKSDETVYDCRDYRGVSIGDDENSYWLYLEKVRGDYYLAIERIINDEDGYEDHRYTLGLIRINPESKHYEIDRYVRDIDCLIEL